jgi:Cdc6-like AAA superfamily ATPase
LITLIGLPGVGKSSIIRSTLHHLSERSLLKGGSILLNARAVFSCETFIRKLNFQLIHENPIMFSQAKEFCEKSQHDCIKTFNLIMQKISYIEGSILMVMDNCEELIERDRNNFKILLSTILCLVPKIKILLTSRVRLACSLPESDEEFIVLSSLTNF